MQIATSWSTMAESSAAFAAAMEGLVGKLGSYPSLLLVYFTEAYPADDLRLALAELPPGVKVQGCSTCRGVMTEAGLHGEDGRALALMGIRDEGGAFGVGAMPMADNPRSAAAAAIKTALADSDRSGELPGLVWLTASPGHEEQVLQGIQDVVGSKVPVVGGSAADNTVAGRWSILTRDIASGDAVVVSVLFPTGRMAYSFQSGYVPTRSGGTVTSATGRIVHAIDRRPAAEVYRAWTGSLLDGIPARGGNILTLTTHTPLGRMVGSASGVPYYTLSHPDAVLEDGSLSLFTEVAEGQELVLMKGSDESLLARAGHTTEDAIALGGCASDHVLGAMVVYCAGCMLTVQARMPEVVDGLNAVLEGKPFIGVFTFGEQGCMLDGRASHGNLMISSLVFCA